MDFRAMLKKKKYAKWGTDEDDPDWGNLKHVEDQVDGGLKKAERVSLTLVAKSYFFISQFNAHLRVRRALTTR